MFTNKDDIFASKIVVSLIKSPFYKAHQVNLDRELKQHFKKTLKLKLHDRFTLESFNQKDSKYQFKIVDIEPKAEELLVNNVQTTLVQTELAIIDEWKWATKDEFKIVLNYTNEIQKIMTFYKSFHESSEILPLILLHGPSGSGKLRVVEALAAKQSMHLCSVNAISLVSDSAAAVEKRVEIFMNQSVEYGPCIIYIKSFPLLFKLKDINEFNKRVINYFFRLITALKSSNSNFFIICASNSKQAIDPAILVNFNFEVEVKSLSDDQRLLFLEKINFTSDARNALLPREEEIFLKKSSGFYYGELSALHDCINSQINTVDSKESIEHILNTSFKIYSKNRKFHQENKLNIDKINWSDIGGLENIKQVIIDTILFPLNYPSLFASNGKQLGITRSGILLCGPPGTGKTLMAKAISNECELNFLSVKGPELLDMYVGQTEQNVRDLFEKARLNAPCVLFFDELDSLTPVRGRSGDSGGVMDRVVSQLLTEIDGLDKFCSTNSAKKSNQIFLIGATNRPDLIDPSLLRPGRFDKLIYVPIAKSFDERLNIFEALIRKLPVDKSFVKEKFIENCPKNLSGADFYSLTSKARYQALKRLLNKCENDPGLEIDDEDIELSEEDFNSALVGFQPTLSEAAFAEYEKYFDGYLNVK